MSKTFTSRPAVTQGRGRGTRSTAQTQTNTRNTRGTSTATDTQQKMYGNTGGLGNGPGGVGRGIGGPGRGTRGAGRGAGGVNRGSGYGVSNYNRRDAMNDDEVQETERQQAQIPQEQRMSYQGGYTMISPNEKKRQEIQQMARQEETAYNTYKQQNTPTTLNYVGTAGGGELREADVRKKAQQDFSKVKRLERQRQLSANKRSIEQAEIDRKKAEQREKAEMNERRRMEEEANEARKWDEQRRRTNEAFLRRLENKSKKHAVSTPQTSSAQEASFSLPRPTHPTSSPSIKGTQSVETSNRLTAIPVTRDKVTDELEKKVIALNAIYPQYEESELREILKQLNGSLDEAVAVLQD